LRILRPARIVPPPPPLDPADVLALLDESASRPPPAIAPEPSARPFVGEGDQLVQLRPAANAGGAGSARPTGYRHETNPPHAPRPAFRVNPFLIAIAVAIVGVMFLLTIDRETGNSLYIRRISAAEVPIVDGEASDPIWRKVPALSVVTEHGENFNGTGGTTVSIQAVHDGVWAYFLFIWDDPTRSLKQLPLRKSATGWQLIHDGYENGDEHAYNEDKFSILLTGLDATLAGDNTFHAGAAPAAGMPRTLSGRGLHYTMKEGLYADVWQWKATSTNSTGFIDDCYFGPPAIGTKAQFDGAEPYRGGFAPDPGSANYLDNFLPRPPRNYSEGVVPRRLPKDLAATTAALGRINLDPNQGDGERARWYITEEESVPYSPERDRLIPQGTIIPGVILSGKYSGDRADVRGAARWAAGRWALEVVRRLESKSRYDMPIATGMFMRVAAFDHAQIRHTRHVRPIRLEVE
jgi:hypothetical protein